MRQWRETGFGERLLRDSRSDCGAAKRYADARHDDRGGTRNVVGGDVPGQLVQAGAIHGDVHLHRPPPLVPRQLPPSPAHFTNRRREQAALDRIATNGRASGRSALAMLTGPGGAGKTATALYWLHHNLERFPDGQLYADLGAFGVPGPAPPSEVLHGFLRALGATPDDIPLELAGRSALFRSMTAGKALAVLADDAESAAQVRPLLPASPDSVVLTTSRHRLAGLALDGGQLVPIDVLDESSAVTLISRVVGEEKVAREPAPTRRLVQLCGGLPIALRVAAARLANRPRWSISRIVDALADRQGRLESLTVSGDASVRASFDLSYRELRPEVARLYRLLGLHPGAEFGLGVIAAAANVSPDVADDLVGELIDVSLVNELGDGRFRSHDLLRLHARYHAEQQEDLAERESAARRMVTWYLDHTIAADLVLAASRRRVNDRYEHIRRQPPPFHTAAAALDWLEAERPNILAAQRRAAESAWWELAWQLCEAAWGMFLLRKNFEPWIASHELGVAAARRCGDSGAESILTVHLGIAYLNLQRYDTAYELFTAAFEVGRTADVGMEATALEHLGLAARRLGRTAEAMDHFTAALTITEHTGEHRGTALHLRRIGETLSESGRDDEALPYLRRAVTAAAGVADPVLHAQALTRLGTMLTRAGDATSARQNLLEAVDTLADAGSDHYHADAVLALGDLELRLGDETAARRQYQLALDLYTRAGMPRAHQVQERLDQLGAQLPSPRES
jgi:tetratricopeptide (TPR) repeat protein